MKFPPVPTNFSTPRRVAVDFMQIDSRLDEEDAAIGCECANPALQIESWCDEAAAQPLQQFY
jgi:hypothetical protein